VFDKSKITLSNPIRKSKEFAKEVKIFDELQSVIVSLGGLMVEDDLLNHISKDKSIHNHLSLILILVTVLRKERGEYFKHRW